MLHYLSKSVLYDVEQFCKLKKAQEISGETTKPDSGICCRDLDASETNYPDDVYIIRDRSCFNYAGNGPALAPLLSPSVSQYLNLTQPTVAASTSVATSSIAG